MYFSSSIDEDWDTAFLLPVVLVEEEDVGDVDTVVAALVLSSG
jgi:hypothetical protein